LSRNEQQIPQFSGWNIDLLPLRAQYGGRMDFDGAKEVRGGELVQLLTLIFDVKAIGDPGPENEMARCENVFHYHHINDFRASG